MGEEGQGHNTITKNVVMMQCKFGTGSLKINISKLLFWGLAQERLLSTLLIMLTIMDDPLIIMDDPLTAWF